MEQSLIQKAYHYAIKCHTETNHLYDGKEYLTHLEMVYQNAIKFQHIIPADIKDAVLAACWVHDVIEDARQTYNDVVAATSVEVAEIAYALTNDKGKNRKERAGKNYYNGIKKTPGAVFVKICDRIANTEYSKSTGSSMYKKYKDEFHEFEDYLYSEIYETMFRILYAI